LQYNEFFRADEIAKAKVLLRQGEERAAQLAQGQAPWTTATGLVVRGYVSKIDKSVQPYGLVVPASYSPTAPHRWRLDTWFLTQRDAERGEFSGGSGADSGRICASGHDCFAPVRAVLQCQQACGRGRSV